MTCAVLDFCLLARPSYDLNSIVADPLFVDPDNDGYRLQPGSPAFSLGLVELDFDNVGVWCELVE